MITATQKRILYLLYCLSVVIVCLVALFPSDTLSRYLTSTLVMPASGVQVAIEHVRPAFPPGIQLTSVDLRQGKTRFLKAEQITIRPSLLTLFKPLTNFSIQGKIQSGSLDGNVSIDRKQRSRFKADMHLTGVNIKDSDIVHHILKRQISGTLDATVHLSRLEAPSEALKVQLTVSDGRIELLPSLLDIGQLNFKQIKADLSATVDRVVIKNGTFRGEQIDGTLSGSILMRSPIGESTISLSGRIKPHHQFLKRIQKIFPVGRLSPKRMADKGVPVRLGGTLNKPSFSLGG